MQLCATEHSDAGETGKISQSRSTESVLLTTTHGDQHRKREAQRTICGNSCHRDDVSLSSGRVDALWKGRQSSKGRKVEGVIVAKGLCDSKGLERWINKDGMVSGFVSR